MSMNRRELIKAAPAVAALVATPALSAGADAAAAPPPHGGVPVAYTFFRPSESLFVERLANHMVPADALSPSGSELGIPVYIDRALGSGWGKGERLYLQGPFAPGSPNQGYQLALSPAQLFRLGTQGLLQHCRGTLGKDFAALDGAALDRLLESLRDGKVELADEVPSAEYFSLLYNLVREGLFADPAYGGNRNKAGWRMLGFSGVIQSNKRNILRYRDVPYRAEPLGIADVSGWVES